MHMILMTYRDAFMNIRLLCTSSVIAAGIFHASAAQASPPQQTVVVNGGGAGGYVLTDAIQTSNQNPKVVNSGNGQVTVGNAQAVQAGSNLTVGSTTSETLFTNFNTQGGTGSGGGAGLGGVFFVDAGSSLSLYNVSFSANMAKGGQGGSAPQIQLAPISVAVQNQSVDATATQIINATPIIASQNGQLVITGMQLSNANPLVAQNADVSLDGNSVASSVASVTNSGLTVNFSNAVAVSNAALVSVSQSVNQLSNANRTISFASPNLTSSQVGTGMAVVGLGIPAGTTVQSLTYDMNGHVTSMTLSAAVDPTQLQMATVALNVVDINSFDVSKFQTVNGNTIKPNAVAGLSVGMSVTGTGIPAGTVITAVNSDGTVTLNNNIASAVGFTATLQSVVSNSGQAVMNLGSVTGLSVGQGVSGVGIPSGTTIVAINGNTITLSNAVQQATLDAISAGTMTLSFDKVIAVAQNGSTGTVTLSSTAGLKVGAVLTGDSSIPANAQITGITGNTVTYRINSSAALTTGGSMNGLVTSGVTGANGAGGVNGGWYNVYFHDGEGESGTNGYNATNPSNAGSGVGAKGGNGGNGSNGIPFNFDLFDTVVSDTAALVKDGAEDAALLLDFPPDGAASAAKAATVAMEAINLAQAIADTVKWGIDLSNGQTNFGGGGGSGGNGGNGSIFFGGGAGGNGGSGGAGALAVTDGGAGGQGGSGGAGGFGAGGGSGGAGGAGGANGQSVPGSDGSGGSAGFGAGVGSSNGVGGGGGSGYGGAIFVTNGGALTISGNSLFQNNNVLGGSSNNGGQAGSSSGSDLFMMKGSYVVLSPGVGNVIEFDGTIADDSAASIGSASWASGDGADLHITGGGLVRLLGANTYTGNTSIEGATLQADDGQGINSDSHILFAGLGTIGNGLSTLNGGVWMPDSQTTVVRQVGDTLPTQISWSGSGGFAANSGGLNLNFGSINGGLGQTLVWNQDGFVPAGSTLIFGSDAAAATGVVTLVNDVNLNANNGQIAVYANTPQNYKTPGAILTGNWSNGTLTVNDTSYNGTLAMVGQNSLSGITVNNGTVITALFDGNGNITQTGQLMDPTNGGYVNITGQAMLALYQDERLTTVSVAQAGTLFSNANVTSGDILNSGTIVFKGSVNTTGDIVNTGSGLVDISGAVNTGTIANAGEVLLGYGGSPSVTTGMIQNTNTALMHIVSGTVATGGIYNDGTLTLNGTTAVTTGNITNSGLLAVQSASVVTGALSNYLTMTIAGTNSVATGNIANASNGVLSIQSANIATGTLVNVGAASLVGGTTITTGDVVNSANGTLMLQAPTITTGNLTNNTGASLWWMGAGNTQTVLNDVGSTFYLAGDLTANGTVTNYGMLYVVGQLNQAGSAETGRATRTIYTTGFWDPQGTYQLGGLTGLLANTLIINQSGSSVNSGVFTGAGSLVFTGGGTMNMTGASNFTGGLTIEGGSTIDTTGGGTFANSLGVTVADGASTLIVGTATGIGSLTNAGTVTANAMFGVGGNVTNTGTLNVNYVDPNAASPMPSLVVNGSVTNTGGTINLAADSITLIGGNLVNSGTVSNNAGALRVGGNVTNSGTIGIGANSVTTFTGSLANTGMITTASALSIGSLSGASGTITLNNTALLTINQTANGTYSGTITGSGSVLKDGAATLTLAGVANTFSPAALEIAQGTLAVNGAGILNQALAVAVDGGATLGLVSGNQTIHNLTGTGTLALGTNNLYLANGGTFNGTVTGSGAVQVASGAFTLQHEINAPTALFTVQPGAEITVTQNAEVAAAGLNVNGGTMNLSGVLSAQTTNVTNGGVLHLGNGLDYNQAGYQLGTLTSAQVVVNGGASLSGNGTVAGSVLVGGTSAGTLAPGNSPGLMTVSNLTMANGSTAAMQIDGTAGAGNLGGNDEVVITGQLTLQSGSALSILKTLPANHFELALGQQIKLFQFNPGAVSGMFGSASTTSFANSVIFNIPTGSVIGLGSYTPATFTAAVTNSPNEAAIMNAMLVNTAGGVNQYYGGNLMGYVTGALASGQNGATDAAFARWSPEAYSGIVDQMKLSVIDNLLDLSSYDTLTAGKTYAIGDMSRSGVDGANVSGYAQNIFRDTALNAGFAHQFGGAEVSLAFGHTMGSFYGNNINGTINGNQVIAGVSVPFAMAQKMRVFGQFTYGAYQTKGSRMTNTGNADFAGVQSHTFAYDFGMAYHQGGTTQVDVSAEAIGMSETLRGFTEMAAVANSAGVLDMMSIDQTDHTAWVARLKAKVGTQLAPNLLGFVKVVYDHEMGQVMTPISGNVAVESTSFSVNNPGLGRSRASAGAGFKFDLSKSVQFNAEARAGTDATYTFNGGLRLVF